MRNVISIGYGRHLFEAGATDRERLIACASMTKKFDMVIFSNKQHALKTETVSDTLTLHPTNSRNNILALFDAFALARKLIKSVSSPVTLTTQDPFETALIGIILKKLYGVKLVIQEHGDFFGQPYWRQESGLNRLRYRFGLWALRQADVVRVVSERTKKHLEARGIKQITILPVAIDTEAYRGQLVSPLVRELFGPETFVFLSAARFVPQKNLTLLLNAFFDAYEKVPHIRLLLVGKGSEQDVVEHIMQTRAKGSEQLVRILPWSDDVASLMRASDAYALSSNYEGWGRVLIEALLAKTPIVTTEVGCAGEVVHDGIHGLLVSVGDRVALAHALETLASDTALYESMKQQLEVLEAKTIPGADSTTYPLHWAQIFAA